MAPTKATATKRAGAELKKTAKKAKVDPMLQAVIDCVSESDLPASCISMVTAMLPNSLGVASEKRGAHQVRVVTMAKEILDEAQKKLEAAVEAEAAKVATIEGSRGELTGKTEAAEAAFKSVEEAFLAKKAAVTEKQAEVTSTAEALKVAQAAQKEGDATLIVVETELAKVKTVVDTHLTPICSAEDWKQNEAKKHCDEVLKLLARCTIDESLSKSLPSCCQKAPADRGDFDKMALEQVQKTLEDKINELASKVEAGAAGKAERATAVEEAQKASEAAAEAKKAAGEILLDAEVEKENAAEALRAAKAEVAKFEPELAAATKVLDAAKETLKQFQDYTVSCFETLEKKVSVVEQAPETIEADKLGA